MGLMNDFDEGPELAQTDREPSELEHALNSLEMVQAELRSAVKQLARRLDPAMKQSWQDTGHKVAADGPGSSSSTSGPSSLIVSLVKTRRMQASDTLSIVDFILQNLEV